MAESVLYKSHPTMFRSSPLVFILCIAFAVVTAGLGLVFLLVWWLRVLGTTLTVTNERVTLRKGILSKHTNEVYHTDIRNVQISQGMFQRMFRAGKIGIACAGQSSIEITVNGLPDPEKIKDIVDMYRRSPAH